MFNNKLCILRPVNPAAPNAPFAMLSHLQAAENNNRYEMLGGALERQPIDGFNQIDYHTKIIKVTKYSLFTHLKIEIS